jgi:electron transport complex protein RnfE
VVTESQPTLPESTPLARKVSLWRHNPVLLHLLGLSPLLAVSRLTVTALALALLSSLALLASTVSLHFLTPRFSARWRFFGSVMVLALFTSLLGLYCQAFHPALSAELGIYLPLIACNFALLQQLDFTDGERTLLTRLGSNLQLLAAYTLALLLFAALREWLGSGQVLQGMTLLQPNAVGSIPASGSGRLAQFINLPGAAFLLLGLLVAGYQGLKLLLAPGSQDRNAAVVKAKRARVTEKLNS